MSYILGEALGTARALPGSVREMAGSSHEPLYVPPIVGLKSDGRRALPPVCRPWKRSSIVRCKRRGDQSEAHKLAARHRTAQPLWNVDVDVD
jgi:hypothetical protein